MAEFKGKVIEAYFSNNDKDTICIMWRNGEELNEFYIPVDPDAYYFKTLIEEIPLEEIEEHTQKRAKVYMEEIKRGSIPRPIGLLARRQNDFQPAVR